MRPRDRWEADTPYLSEGIAVIDVMIAIQIEDEGRVSDEGTGADEGVHGTGLLIVVVPRPLLTRHVHQAGQRVALDVHSVTVGLQKHLRPGDKSRLRLRI
jgi:hypothetical protein